MEDGAFKSDHIVIGARCTIGTNAFVHYGITMADGAVLEADSFLMKGEEVATGTTWRGNPARQVGAPPTREAVGVPTDDGNALAHGATALLDDLRLSPTPELNRESGVAVGLFSLDLCRRREDELFALLGDAEQDEARCLRSGDRRSAFVASRALVRLILSAEWHRGIGPREWHLARTDLGRLEVLAPACTGVDLSISHTNSVIAIAVSDSHRVGVDIEPASRGDGADELMWSVLSPSESERLVATPVAERPTLYLRMWTLKEAFAKCTGAGVALPFERLTVSFDPLAVTVDGTGRFDARHWFHQEQWALGSESHWLAVVATTGQGQTTNPPARTAPCPPFRP